MRGVGCIDWLNDCQLVKDGTTAWNWSRRWRMEGGAPVTAPLDYAHYTGDGEVATMPGHWQVRIDLKFLTDSTVIWCARYVDLLTGRVKTWEGGEKELQLIRRFPAFARSSLW